MSSNIKIPSSTKLFFLIGLAGIFTAIYLTYKLNFIMLNYTSAENLRLNFLNLFIFTISSLSLYKTICTFKSKKIDSKINIESKIEIIEKFAKEEGFGIISQTENEVKLIFKSKFLGFYDMPIFVNKNHFEYNVFEYSGKPFDWGIRKKLLNKFDDYITKTNNASL